MLAREPLSEPTVTGNVMKWGTGGLNFAACGNSRLRYAPRASRYEREVGLTIAPEKWQGLGINPARLRRNAHPTVQPVSVMRWLCRFVTPPRGLVLDPFASSGTTGIAAVLEGFAFRLVEQDARYVKIARQRVAHATRFPRDFLPDTPLAQRTKLLNVNDGGLFD